MGKLKIGEIAGIEVILHGTFPLFVAGIGLFVLLTQGGEAALLVVGTLAALFGFVLLHELGHSLVAQRLGIKVRAITLMPLGGLAMTESLPRTPGHEVMIALAGPAVNFVLAGLFVLLRLLAGEAGPLAALVSGEFVHYLIMANLVLGLFNLVPAFPMDGGRVLRALMATRLPYEVATRRAVIVGRVFAGLFVLTGFLRPSFMMLGLIGVFLFVAGGRELKGLRVDQLLHRRSVQEFADPQPWFLADRDTLFGEVCGVLGANPELGYAVVAMEGFRFGLLSRRELLSACLVMPPGLRLHHVVERSLPALRADATVATALGRLRQGRIAALPLIQAGEVVGVVARANLERQLAEAVGRATGSANS